MITGPAIPANSLSLDTFRWILSREALICNLNWEWNRVNSKMPLALWNARQVLLGKELGKSLTQ